MSIPVEILQHMVDHAVAVFYRVDAGNVSFQYLSPGFEKATGYTIDDIEAMGGDRAFLKQVIEGDNFLPFDLDLKQIKGKESINQRAENRWSCKDGSAKCLEVNISPIYDEKCLIGLVGLFCDITDKKETEEQRHVDEAQIHVHKAQVHEAQLRALAVRLTNTESLERRRIASELHDRISQTLILANMKLGTLSTSLSADERIEVCKDVRGLIEQTVEDTQALTFELSPPILYEVGIDAALEWLADWVLNHYELKVMIVGDVRCGMAMNDDRKAFVFGAVRELLINIAKHAKTEAARVRLGGGDDYLQIVVEDDGVGFDVSILDAWHKGFSSYGLFSIREQVRHMGGVLDIQSGANTKGTRVSLRVPVLSVDDKERGI